MSKRPLVTERIVLEAFRQGRTSIAVEPSALITPLAKDTAASKGVAFVLPESHVASNEEGSPAFVNGVIALASDHNGKNLRGFLREYLQAKGLILRDLGTDSNTSVPFSRPASKAANAVRKGVARCAIVIGGCGMGPAMAANKLSGIRAVSCACTVAARDARTHLNANVLALGAKYLTPDMAAEIVDVFLATPFENGIIGEELALLTRLESGETDL